MSLQNYSDNDHHDHGNHDGKMSDDENNNNIGPVLYGQLTRVNNELISIGNNFKLVDNLYFLENGGMIDEFVENMNQFMNQLKDQRKKVAFGKLNSDLLTHVYKFLKTNILINACGLVCKLWRESLNIQLWRCLKPGATKFLNTSLAKYITTLSVNNANAELFEIILNCTNLNQLKVLCCRDNTLDMKCIEYLMKCNFPNLTELDLSWSTINETDTIELLNSNFMSTIKKLDLRFTVQDFTDNFYESVSKSKHLNQLTELTIHNNEDTIIKRRIDLLLKEKINLENLYITSYQLTHFPKLFTNGNYLNLKCLDIFNCLMKNQEFASLLISPYLPNLETVNASCLNKLISDTDIATFPSNSQSNITDLSVFDFNFVPFPTLFNHCPKLKSLSVESTESAESTETLLGMLEKHAKLSNLEFLNISMDDVFEDLFVNPMYANLTGIELAFNEYFDDFTILTNCKNLVNLTSLELSLTQVSEEKFIEQCEKALESNPTFSKLTNIALPTYGTLIF